MSDTKRLLTDHYFKVVKTIRSCENQSHVKTSVRMVQNFESFWISQKNHEHLIRIYLINFKLLIIAVL